MVLDWYITRRFLSYFVGISVMLALLFNVIEFFEKLVRLKTATPGMIIYFLSLRIVPSLFELMPLSIWLTTILMIRELYFHGEWETFPLVSFSLQRFLLLLTVVSACLMVVVFGIRERFVIPLSFTSDQFKEQFLKNGVGKKMVNKWVMIDEATFGYAHLIDFDQQTGEDLLLISMDNDFLLKKIMTVSSFGLDKKHNALICPEGHQYTIDGGEPLVLQNFCLHVPSFFSQLTVQLQAPTAFFLVKNLISCKHFVPGRVFRDFLYELFLRLLFYITFLIFPVTTFLLFCLVPATWYRWLVVALPYPLWLFCETAASALFHLGVGVGVVFLPLVVFFVIIVVLLFFIRGK